MFLKAGVELQTVRSSGDTRTVWQNAVAGSGWFIGKQQGNLMADFQRWSDRYLVKTLLCLTTAYFYAGGSSGTGFYLVLGFIRPRPPAAGAANSD